MRLTALLLTATLTAAPVAAQEPAASSSAPAASPQADTKTPAELPVSLEKIRERLDHPAGTLLVKALDKEPTFRVEVQERRKIEELLATLNFKAGPIPAEGIYAHEMQRIMTPPVDNPLAQPYAAFNQGQLLTILVENLVGKYLAGRALDAVGKSLREHAEAAARREVEDAIAEYCADKPDNGAGIRLCEPPLAIVSR